MAKKQSEPLILFVAPPNCGKTMAAYSLAEYLVGLDEDPYEVTPNLLYDRFNEKYMQKCKDFAETLNYNLSQRKTANPRMAMKKTEGAAMMLDLKRNNELKYNILEVPGEWFWDPNNPEELLDPRIANMLSTTQYGGRRKIVFILLLDLFTMKWINTSDPNKRKDCESYQKRLVEMLSDYYQDGDKVIALFNRFDEASAGDMDIWKEVYSTVLSHNYGKKWVVFPKIRIEQLPYSAGVGFCEQRDKNTNKVTGFKIYESDERMSTYARNLWKAITKKYSWI